jgi:hypothetical protein
MMLTIFFSNYVGSLIGERLHKCEAKHDISLQTLNIEGFGVAVDFIKRKKTEHCSVLLTQCPVTI